MGIFPAGLSLQWGNQSAWIYTGALIDGTITISANLPTGDYEAAVFFDESETKVEAKLAFTVTD